MMEMSLSNLQEIVRKHLQKNESNRKFVGSIYRDVEDMDKILAYFKAMHNDKIDYIVALDGSGFILGSMLSREMRVGFIPVAKCKVSDVFGDEFYRAVYVNHRNESCALVVRKDSLKDHPTVLIVDNWIETGATIAGISSIMEDAGASVAGVITFGMDDNEKTQALVKEMNVRSIV